MLPLSRYLHAVGRFHSRCSMPRGARPERAHPPGRPGGLRPMSRMKWLPTLAFAVALVAPSAHAQIAGHAAELSAGAGVSQFDGRDHLKTSPLATGSFGYRWSTGLTFEA